MRTYGNRSVSRSVVVRVTCDNCGKVANATGEDAPAGWIGFTSSHGDWGNDSIESNREHDACSARCFRFVLSKVVDDYERTAPALPTLSIWLGNFGLKVAKDLLDEGTTG